MRASGTAVSSDGEWASDWVELTVVVSAIDPVEDWAA